MLEQIGIIRKELANATEWFEIKWILPTAYKKKVAGNGNNDIFIISFYDQQLANATRYNMKSNDFSEMTS